MISEERVMEIAECCPIWYAIPQGREKALLISFARAIEREAYKQGQEMMRERAAEMCDGASPHPDHIRKLEIEEPK